MLSVPKEMALAKRKASRPETGAAEHPKLGSKILMPLVGMTDAAFVIADNSVVTSVPRGFTSLSGSSGPSHIEIVHMRALSELLPQEGTVVSGENGGYALELGPIGIRAATTISGRVRMDNESGVNLAAAILHHMLTQHGIPLEVIVDRLQSRGVPLTQGSTE